MAGTSPFRGGFAGSRAKRLPPQRELSAVRLTEDHSLFCGFLLPQGKGISSTIRSAKGSPPSAEGGEGWRRSRHKLLFRACWARPKDGARLAAFRSPPPSLRGTRHFQRRQGAAALSAAVTTTMPIGDAPTLHGHTSRKEESSLFPATLRERGAGGEALLLEKRPLPQNLPPPFRRILWSFCRCRTMLHMVMDAFR